MINARKRLTESVVMFAIPVVALYMLRDISQDEAKMFPKYVCYIMLALASINAIQVFFYLNKMRPIQWPTFLRMSIWRKEGAEPFPLRRVGLSLGLMTAYIFGMETIGFYLSGFLFYFLALLLLETEKLTAATVARKAAYGVCFMGVVYVLFSVMLGVVIPRGILL